MTKPRIKLPDTIRIGDVIEIKTVISHNMETGQRRDPNGRAVPRNIISSFKASFNDISVFSAELQPGISANPYIAFHLKVTGPGDIKFEWSDDTGTIITERQTLVISP
jgi:sulfur-oxidizing protein SoxZ